MIKFARLIMESLAEDAENLANELRRVYKVSPSTITKMYNESNQDYSTFLSALREFKKNLDEDMRQKAERKAKLGPEAGEESDLKFEIDPLGHEDIDDMKLYSPEEFDAKFEDWGGEYTDDGFVEVLQYLSKYWGSKDRVRVLAKRFEVSPEIYLTAGLGNIPDNPTDEDIWNTMDMSGQGEKPFYNSAWQVYYIDTLDKIENLPVEIRKDIANILQKSVEDNIPESYKLGEDVSVLTENGMELISAGTIIKVLKENVDDLESKVNQQILDYKRGMIDYTNCAKNITDLVNEKLNMGGDRDELTSRYNEFIYQLESI